MTRCPCVVGPAAVLSAAEPHPVRPRPARPSLLRCVPGRRQPGGVHARARSQVRPGRSRRAEVERHRPAAASCRGPARRRHAKKEYCVVIFSPRLFPNSSVSSSLSPRSVLHRIKRHRPAAVVRLLPRRVIFVVAQKRDIGMNTMLCLFYLSFLVRLLTSQLVVVLVLLFRPLGIRM